MKKLLGLLILLALFSCEKLDETFCWDCTIYYFTKDLGINELYFEKGYVEKCEYSELDAQRFENQRSTQPAVISVCGDIIRWSDCICEKQQP